MTRYSYVNDPMTDCYCEMEENEFGEYVDYNDMISLLKKLVNKGDLTKDGMKTIVDALAED